MPTKINIHVATGGVLHTKAMTGDVGAVSNERHRRLRCSALSPAGAESDWHYNTCDIRVLRGASATQLIAF